MTKYLSERNDKSEWLFPECAIGIDDKKCFSESCKKAGVKLYQWWEIPELVGKAHVNTSSIESAIRKLGRKANVEKTHPHRFRRTGATYALRRGMPIEQVSRLLGHESIETTQIYLDISEKELEQGHRKYVS